MNRKNLWFLTVFSLILILGVYYITLPSELFNAEKTKEVSSKVDVNVSEEDKLISLRVERDERVNTVMSELQDKIINSNNSEEKNTYFDELQKINLSKGKETYLEDKLLSKLNINSLVEITGDNITVTIAALEHNTSIVSEIMKCVQEEFEDDKNIVIKFTS